MTISTRSQPFGPGELIRLWFSYQRYGIVLASANLLMIAATALAIVEVGGLWPWALLLILVPITGKLGSFAFEVFGAQRRKLRATFTHQRRISSGSFSPTAVRPYCGDPCWRLVALEVLRRAGHSAQARRALVRTFAHELDTDAHAVVIVDHQTGFVRRISDKGDVVTFN